MSLTISELEEQRAKILEEIESKAGKLTSQNSNNNESPSLNDWLNAAEEVMPENPKHTSQQPNPKSSYSNKLLTTSTTSNKTSFFGVIIMLSLLLTILGVLYIAYSSFQKEQEKVLASQNQNFEHINELQTDFNSLQQSVTTGGKTELFTELESKVLALQGEVKELKAIIKSMQGGTVAISANTDQATDTLVVTNTANEEPKQAGSATMLDAENASKTPSTVPAPEKSNNLVTEAVLDQKLDAYTQKLETKIDRKLELILQHLNQGKQIKNLPGLVSSKSTMADEADMEVSTPTVETVKTPTVKEPTLKLTEQVSVPTSPKLPNAPIANASPDISWLLGQSRQNYILQLASMPTQKAAQKMISSRELNDAKVLPQTRNKSTNYIVVTGSLASRAEADKLAKEIKSKYGINPWIRQVNDLVGRVQ
ncbi:SPOR domain-containing protein [Thiomicrorhabdus sp.]|uniref:SPOR domain-containing protein n=1 Tax=Thiomicrorhabdus sp. TaxID=2039724 RepID=UPI002AA95ABE|nr:SPOR domain-containing protein [Thiomicrorhabdus sp.]